MHYFMQYKVIIAQNQTHRKLSYIFPTNRRNYWNLLEIHFPISIENQHFNGKYLTIVSIKVFRYAPLQTPFSDAERGFTKNNGATTLLQIKKTPNHFIDSESGGIQNEVALWQQHLSQRYSNFSINQSLNIFVSGTGELKN